MYYLEIGFHNGRTKIISTNSLKEACAIMVFLKMQKNILYSEIIGSNKIARCSRS